MDVGWITLVAAPLAFVALTAASPSVYYPAIIVAELLLFMSTGPINSAIANLVSPTERASAFALSMFVIHLLGDVPSPTLIGWLVRSLFPGEGRADRARGDRDQRNRVAGFRASVSGGCQPVDNSAADPARRRR